MQYVNLKKLSETDRRIVQPDNRYGVPGAGWQGKDGYWMQESWCMVIISGNELFNYQEELIALFSMDPG